MHVHYAYLGNDSCITRLTEWPLIQDRLASCTGNYFVVDNLHHNRRARMPRHDFWSIQECSMSCLGCPYEQYGHVTFERHIAGLFLKLFQDAGRTSAHSKHWSCTAAIFIKFRKSFSSPCLIPSINAWSLLCMCTRPSLCPTIAINQPTQKIEAWFGRFVEVLRSKGCVRMPVLGWSMRVACCDWCVGRTKLQGYAWKLAPYIRTCQGFRNCQLAVYPSWWGIDQYRRNSTQIHNVTKARHVALDRHIQGNLHTKRQTKLLWTDCYLRWRKVWIVKTFQRS